MTVTSQDVCIYAADSELISVALVDANGAPFVLAPGGDIEWRMAETSHDDVCIIRKTLGDGILLQDSVAEITLTRLDTDLAPGVYYQQLNVVDPSVDDVIVAMIGAFVVKRSLRMPRSEIGASRMSIGGTLACNATRA